MASNLETATIQPESVTVAKEVQECEVIDVSEYLKNEVS